MFFSLRTLPFVALGLTALSLATPTRRAPALEVSLSAPKSIGSIGDLRITASVTNTGSESVKVLKYGTVLDDGMTRSFAISKGGADAAFTGVKISLNIDALDETAFFVIPAGESVSVTHDVSALYDFSSLGPGAFTFTPVTMFQVLPGDADVAEHKVSAQNRLEVSAAAVEVEVTNDVARRELKAKRATVSCSTSSYKSFITSAYSEGKSLASVASSYIGTNGANTLFKSYYGTSSTTTIRNVFNNVANEASSSRTLNCSDPYGACTSGVIAYTLIATTNIYFCSPFYSEVTTTSLCSGTTVASRNIRGGTVLHELTHATSGTTDVGYGCSYDQSLGSSNPSSAANNADNYNCFATQVYASTKC